MNAVKFTVLAQKIRNKKKYSAMDKNKAISLKNNQKKICWFKKM